jgi:phosphatidylglycerol---prolipoprotein diacylglyceryl transferase
VPTYGLLLALAIVTAFFVLRRDLGRRAMGIDAEALVAVPAVAGIIGSKLYHVLESPRNLLANPAGELFSPFGFAWLGGLIAGFCAFIYLARRYRIPLLELCDAASPAAAIGYGVGRIGCLLSGDGDYGIPTSLPWGMSFPNGLVPTTQRVHPTPIYEFLGSLVICWILWRLGAAQVRAREGASPQDAGTTLAKSGSIFAIYLVATGMARFLVEFIRINPRSFLGILTNAQVGSAVSIVVGLVLWVGLDRQRERA